MENLTKRCNNSSSFQNFMTIGLKKIHRFREMNILLEQMKLGTSSQQDYIVEIGNNQMVNSHHLALEKTTNSLKPHLQMEISKVRLKNLLLKMNIESQDNIN